MVINPEKILKICGNFSEIKTVAKFGARIGQTLTSTLKTIEIDDDFCTENCDIERNNYIFSDGVGTITYDFAKEISRELDLLEIPSAFQGRGMD
jgi:RNA-dependent RNA polymerase